MSNNLTIRIRCPQGNKTVSCSENSTFKSLKELVASQTSIPCNNQAIKWGFPPKQLEAQDSATLKAIGIASGETLILDKLEQESLSTQSSSIIRRIIPADNSCLFNSVAYAAENKQKTSGNHLREIIAVFVQSDPVTYNEAYLDKSPQEYVSWILKETSWGGAIELAILSKYFQKQIAAVSIQNARMDLFGQEENYTERIYVIYDGIHYDVLARNKSEQEPEATDETVFSVDDQSAFEGALDLAQELQKKKQYTDVANFSLMCGTCYTGLKGEKEALEHNKATGHTNFQEVNS